MASGPITSWQLEGEKVKAVTDFLFLGSKITADDYCRHEIRRHLFFWKKTMTNLDSVLKSKDSTLLTEVCIVKSMVFPIVTYRCESWTIKKKVYRRIDAFKPWYWRRLLRESPLDNKENKPFSLKGNQPWILIQITDAEAVAPILCPTDVNSLLIGEDAAAGKDWRQKEKNAAEDEMVGLHHRCNGHELGQTLGDGEGQGSLACYNPWGHEELDMTWPLNNFDVERW